MNIFRQATRVASVASLLALLGCGGGEDVSTRSVHRARERWERAGIRDYNLEWTTAGLRDGHYRAYVRGGTVRAVRAVGPRGKETTLKPADPSYYGVEGLFKTLEQEAAQLLDDRPFNQPKGTHVLLKFTPDPKLGYPRSYRRDVVGSPKGLAIDVIRLDVDPPAAIPPAAG